MKVKLISNVSILGGVVCVYAGQPLDTIKVKMQTFPTMYRGMLHCCYSTLSNEGISGLYKGTTPALLCTVSDCSVLFVSYGGIKKMIGSIVGRSEHNLT